MTKELKSKKYYIDGMHCAACEILIEDMIIKNNNVSSVDASLKNNSVCIYYKPGKKPNIAEINAKIAEHGYSINEKISVSENEESVFIRGLYIFTVTFLVLFAFFIIEKLSIGKYISVDGKSAIFAFLLLGFIAGTSSCAALIGGLLLSLNKRWGMNNTSIKNNSQILFHLGRIVSFFILGGLLGLFGSLITFNNTSITSALVITTSIVMIILALQMLGIRQTNKLRFAIPKSIFNKIFARVNRSKMSPKEPFLVGAATFFLPCGFTLMAQTAAIATGSFLRGSMVMLAFAIGTLPALAFIGFSGNKAVNDRDGNLIKVAGLVVIFFALYSINSQLNVLGFKSASDVLSKKNSGQVSETANMQTINIVAKDFSYVPVSSTTIKSGKGKIIIDNQGIEGCGAFAAARGLFDGYVALKSGMNEIEIIATPGTYKLTCTMGMVKPVIITVI